MSGVWDQFWSREQGSRGGGCLSARWQGIESQQRKAWQQFVRILPARAHVLDLATGDGRVMGWMIDSRRDLKLIGIDQAAEIPPPPKGTRARGGVGMEKLPFANTSQEAVVSQFGFEYGDQDAVLSEMLRVLKSGGRVGLMTHRLDGPILEHNRARRDGLEWVLREAELLAKARGSLVLRHVGVSVTPAIAATPGEARTRFGAGSAGWELAEAVVQTLSLGRNDDPRHVLQLLDTLEAKARNEIGRIDSLERACHGVADTDALRHRFERRGLHLESCSAVLEKSSERPFADFWSLRKD